MSDQHPDDAAVDAFAAAMKAKMRHSREKKGRGGWEQCPPESLWRMLREHVLKGDPVDVANLAMMIWHHQQRSLTLPQTATDPIVAALEVLAMRGMLRFGAHERINREAMAEALDAAEDAEILASRCDEPGCTRSSSCGFPTETGYRRTCGEHYAPRPAGTRPSAPGALPGQADHT